MQKTIDSWSLNDMVSFSTSLTCLSGERSSFFKKVYPSGGLKREALCANVVASVAVLPDASKVEKHVPKGDMWSVHKFGGTSMGTSKRIQNVADIVVKDDSERKLVVVSAMAKVTDMMYNLIDKAQSRDDSYVVALDDISEKYRLTAVELLDGDDLSSFL